MWVEMVLLVGLNSAEEEQNSDDREGAYACGIVVSY